MKPTFLITYIFLSQLIYGQLTHDSLVKEVTAYFDSFNTRLLTPLVSNKKADLTIFSTENSIPTYYLDSLYQVQLNLAKKDIGLKLKLNSRISFGDELTSINDSAQLSKYQVKAGVQWDVLKEGFKNSLLNQSIIQNKQLIQQLNERLNNHELQYLSRYQIITHQFYKGLKTELTVQLTLLQKQLKLFTTMYYLHLVPYSQILELKKQIEAIELELHKIPFSNDLSFEKNPSIQEISQWEVFNINLNQLLMHYQNNTVSDSILILEKENLTYKFKKQNLINFNLFAEYQVRTTNQNQTVLNSFIGGRLTIPLATSKKKKQQTVYYEEKILEEQFLVKKDKTVQQIKTQHEQYQKLVQQMQRLYYQLFIELENLKTQTFIKNELTTFSTATLASFQYQNNILEIRKKMLETKKNLYIKALEIFTLACVSKSELTSETIIEKVHWKELYYPHIIFMLNIEKPLHDIHFFIQYLKRKEFKKIYVTKSSSEHYKLTRQLLKMEGFTLLDHIDKLPVINVNQYQSSFTLFQIINESKTTIVIDNLHDFIELEQNTLKMQWQ